MALLLAQSACASRSPPEKKATQRAWPDLRVGDGFFAGPSMLDELSSSWAHGAASAEHLGDQMKENIQQAADDAAHIPSRLHNIFDCYYGCGGQGLCDGFCGSGGACCRTDYAELGCPRKACEGYHCCMPPSGPPPPSPPPSPPGNCYYKCAGEGPCPFMCGAGNACCRTGYFVLGCPETACDDYHCCDRSCYHSQEASYPGNECLGICTADAKPPSPPSGGCGFLWFGCGLVAEPAATDGARQAVTPVGRVAFATMAAMLALLARRRLVARRPLLF
ncbi:hypothetical protein EMIHUDRAFT_218077 [Emiliania huxleyi CCMP1516]|uniref:Granulins domain-containing protein n=2 Tax=Emiliania huxleyi TaxID=2903 RepID=A0A0D3I9T3_EMIH1|nr:hypothetical protein EMIHUDRAFT_218077 [Emiliania huxleyi CCMP1516]EOD08018.1 hypothetical protein EMIHUDRAFT_218077 [Emiliania huxleyi CCMP1516]|eukprot:XP_005760447.1 hypothetical protein EMIHUDRAFT_218077 [Emiliania huxleyi CCMP1516]